MLAPLFQQQNGLVEAPIILVQPTAINVAAGAFASFTVVAAGAGLSYQWFKNNSPIAGANAAALSYGPAVYPADSGAQFYVVVSNSAGLITSGVAVLLVLLAPVFIVPQGGTTGDSLVKGALRRITSYMSGETIDAPDAQDVLETLNDLLDSLSTDKASVYCSVENILTFTPGKYQYTVGNYAGGSVDR